MREYRALGEVNQKSCVGGERGTEQALIRKIKSRSRLWAQSLDATVDVERDSNAEENSKSRKHNNRRGKKGKKREPFR